MSLHSSALTLGRCWAYHRHQRSGAQTFSPWCSPAIRGLWRSAAINTSAQSSLALGARLLGYFGTPVDPRLSAAQVLGFWLWPGYSRAGGSPTPVVQPLQRSTVAALDQSDTAAPAPARPVPWAFGCSTLRTTALGFPALVMDLFSALLFKARPFLAVSRSGLVLSPLESSAAPMLGHSDPRPLRSLPAPVLGWSGARISSAQMLRCLVAFVLGFSSDQSPRRCPANLALGLSKARPWSATSALSASPLLRLANSSL